MIGDFTSEKLLKIQGNLAAEGHGLPTITRLNSHVCLFRK